MRRLFVSMLAPFFITATLWVSAASAAEPRLRVGRLFCQMGPTIGVFIGSRQSVQCQFRRRAGGPVERYDGAITRAGLDIGGTLGGRVTWAVRAPAPAIRPGMLEGRFFGVSGDFALGVGAGVKVLVGGNQESVTLQPLALSGRIGLSAAAGVANLSLTYQGHG